MTEEQSIIIQLADIKIVSERIVKHIKRDTKINNANIVINKLKTITKQLHELQKDIINM